MKNHTAENYFSTPPDGLDNLDVAERLEETADLLADRGADPFRIRAYRNGAAVLAQLEEPLRELIARDGEAGLRRLPGIGPTLARAVTELCLTGRWSRRERLLPDAGDFGALPGVGPKLAARLRRELGTDDIEELARAARDGRLGRVSGVGPRRAAAIRAALGERARRRWRLSRRRRPAPSVAQLLSAERAFRSGGASVWHGEAGRWHLTALYADSALARRLGRGRDWVVVYHDDCTYSGLHTVVSETRGPLAGRRVVRGREAECRDHYRDRSDDGRTVRDSAGKPEIPGNRKGPAPTPSGVL